MNKEQWIKSLKEECEKYGNVNYLKSDFTDELKKELENHFIFKSVDNTGLKVLNEETHKYFYLNKKQGDNYEISLKEETK